MVVLRLVGGLGNQIFQRCFGYALEALGNEVAFDLSYFETDPSRAYALDHWNAEVPVVRATGKEIMEPDLTYHPEILKNYDEDVTLSGYWQCPAYWTPEVQNKIRESFVLREPLDDKSYEFARQIIHSPSVALHVRRTDSLAARGLAFHGVCSGEYYAKAVEYIAARVQNPSFFVFSDDIDWCKTNIDLPFSTTFVDCNSTGITVQPDNEVRKTDSGAEHSDLWLMSRCKHHITANSSFSAFAAWLRKDGIKISPQQWFTPANNHLSKDMAPWLRI